MLKTVFSQLLSVFMITFAEKRKSFCNIMVTIIAAHVRQYPFSVLCIVAVWMLSLTPFFPETPLDDVKFIDKWTHLLMYGGTCSVIWWEYIKNHQSLDFEKLLFYAVLAPMAMGGLLELLQAYCTTTRNGDWLDFAANSCGVLLAVAVGRVSYRLVRKRWK